MVLHIPYQQAMRHMHQHSPKRYLSLPLLFYYIDSRLKDLLHFHYNSKDPNTATHFQTRYLSVEQIHIRYQSQKISPLNSPDTTLVQRIHNSLRFHKM